jgi:inner membrane protein
MEPLTHFMTGACLARTGFNRRAAYATLAMTLAAEAPDLDTLWSVVGPHAGPIAAFQHHRGITHTFIGLPFEGAIVVGAIYLVHRVRLHRAKAAASHPPGAPSFAHYAKGGLSFAEANDRTSSSQPHPLTKAPVHWPLLYGFVLLALLSHLLLDWTNNYGIRPFFPFNPRWYADSIVFIFEPILFAVLLIGLTAPALFGLIAGEVGARRQPFRGRGWAVFALVAMLALWTWRQIEHDRAIQLASNATYGPAETPAPILPSDVLRVTVSPYPFDPYRWHAVIEAPDFYQIATADTLHHSLDTDPSEDIFYKPPTTMSTLIAKRTWLGEVYLDWSSWPLITDTGRVSSIPVPLATSVATPPGTTAVTFRDLRFMYDTFLQNGRRDPPISGTVYIDLAADEPHRVVEMTMGGRPQR